MKFFKKLRDELLDIYLISNTISYALIYALSLKIFFSFVDNISIRIIFSVIAFFLCGYLQQWVIARLICFVIDKIKEILKIEEK
ncbi:MAG: hypothetical protein UHK60_02520 [Acutalibacteraceae bacterium]|nr:hypothetical protein [Acutalibacteraceae bacterium]